MDGGTQIQSVFPNVPAPIHAVQGGGGGQSTAWKMMPVEISQGVKAPEISVTPGNLKKYKAKWKRSLGPNIPSRRKPRGDPHILVGTLNVLECPVFIVAPLRGNKDAAMAVIAWAKDTLESDSKAHVVFMGPLGSGKEGAFIEKHLEALQVNYSGRALLVSNVESALYALDGLRITGIPNTSKQIALGFIPDSQNIYHSSSRTLDCLKLDTLRIPANQKDSDDSPSIHLLEFDKPSREYDSEKKPAAKMITGNRTLKAPPGWVTEIAFSQMKGGDGEAAAVPAAVPAVVPAAVPAAAAVATPSEARAASVIAAREKLEAAKVAKQTADAKVTTTVEARIAAIKAAREANAADKGAAKAAEKKATADEAAAKAAQDKATADEAAAKAAQDKATADEAAAKAAQDLLKSPEPVASTEAAQPAQPTNTVPANTPAATNATAANATPSPTAADENTSEESDPSESKKPVIFGESTYEIGDPKSPGVLKRWQKGDFNRAETKLLDEGGLKYENKIYALFLQGLAEHTCDTESQTMTNPACKVYRFIMARQYENKIKSKNSGVAKPFVPSNSSGTSSSRKNFVPDPELMKPLPVSKVERFHTPVSMPKNSNTEPVRSSGRAPRPRSPLRSGTEPIESSGRAPRPRSPPRVGSVTGDIKGINPTNLNVDQASDLAEIASYESSKAIQSAKDAEKAARNAVNAAAQMNSTKVQSNSMPQGSIEPSNLNVDQASDLAEIASYESSKAIEAAKDAEKAARNAVNAAAELNSTNFQSNPMPQGAMEPTSLNVDQASALAQIASRESLKAIEAAKGAEKAARNAINAAAEANAEGFTSNPTPTGYVDVAPSAYVKPKERVDFERAQSAARAAKAAQEAARGAPLPQRQAPGGTERPGELRSNLYEPPTFVGQRNPNAIRGLEASQAAARAARNAEETARRAPLPEQQAPGGNELVDELHSNLYEQPNSVGERNPNAIRGLEASQAAARAARDAEEAARRAPLPQGQAPGGNERPGELHSNLPEEPTLREREPGAIRGLEANQAAARAARDAEEAARGAPLPQGQAPGGNERPGELRSNLHEEPTLRERDPAAVRGLEANQAAARAARDAEEAARRTSAPPSLNILPNLEAQAAAEANAEKFRSNPDRSDTVAQPSVGSNQPANDPFNMFKNAAAKPAAPSNGTNIFANTRPPVPNNPFNMFNNTTGAAPAADVTNIVPSSAAASSAPVVATPNTPAVAAPGVAENPVDSAVIKRINNSTEWYDILGVDQGASESNVKKAYRKLARLVHPDKAGQEFTERFKKISKAYDNSKGQNSNNESSTGESNTENQEINPAEHAEMTKLSVLVHDLVKPVMNNVNIAKKSAKAAEHAADLAERATLDAKIKKDSLIQEKRTQFTVTTAADKAVKNYNDAEKRSTEIRRLANIAKEKDASIAEMLEQFFIASDKLEEALENKNLEETRNQYREADTYAKNISAASVDAANAAKEARGKLTTLEKLKHAMSGGTRRRRNAKNKSPKKRRAKKSLKKRVSKSKTYKKRTAKYRS